MVTRKFTPVQQANPEVLRPNFGQHTPAIEELLKLLSGAMHWRGVKQEAVAQRRRDLHVAEQNLADLDRSIESYRGAIRALGGEVPDDEPPCAA
jgi:hypothetical protein